MSIPREQQKHQNEEMEIVDSVISLLSTYVKSTNRGGANIDPWAII